ncbi:putative reverse transcriptase domain-containing protein, partial [Tanacetum coccineum]
MCALTGCHGREPLVSRSEPTDVYHVEFGCCRLKHHHGKCGNIYIAFIHVKLRCYELRSMMHELTGELSDEGSPRVIVYGYDGLPIQPVALPSPDYIPGPEDPQAPLVLQDEDEREPMFVQAYDPDYVLEPIYPEYIPLEDEHVFPAEEQPLPSVDSPTALSLGYVADSDPEEDPEEEHADYPTDRGNDDDDNDDDDDIDDEEPFEEEEEEHLALTDPSDVHVAPILLPPEEEVERLIALPTPPPSPLISLLPPTTEKRLARCLAAPALPSSPLPRLPHPYGSPNHVRAPPGFRAAMGRLRASSPLPPPIPASLPLPSPPLPPLPSSPLPPLPDSLSIPPVERREDIPKAKLPPRKRLCLTTPASRYEVGKSSIAVPRPTGGHRVDYGFIGIQDLHLDVGSPYQCTRVTDTALTAQVSSLQGHLATALGEIRALQAREQARVDVPEGTVSTNNMPPKRTSVSTKTARAAAAPMTAAAVEQLVAHFKSVFGYFSSFLKVKENQVKFATCTFIGNALTWWNSHKNAVTQDVADAMDWKALKKMMTVKYCPRGEIKKLEIELWNLKVKGTDIPSYTLR